MVVIISSQHYITKIEKPLKPEDLSGFLGAAGRIRTADLILTNGILLIFLAQKFVYSVVFFDSHFVFGE